MNRLKNEILKLPTTPNGDIDWDFMEAQGRFAEEEVLKESPLYEKFKKIIEKE